MLRICGVHLWMALALLVGCASGPVPRAPGLASVFGEVRLVPRPGLVLPAADGEEYLDRRLRGAVLVDYSRPGYAVVYAEGPPAGGLARLAIRRGRVRTRLEPEYAALGTGGRIEVRNASPEAQVVSLPGAGVLRRLDPGEALRIEAGVAGEQSVFLLGSGAAEARVFVAPGPYAVVSPQGRYELPDLAPGARRLSVWHPRFPGSEHRVELAAGARLRLDLELGVHAMEPEASNAAQH